MKDEKLWEGTGLKQGEETAEVSSVIQNGIVNIDKLLECKNFAFVKKMLGEYPIHLIEQLNNYFQHKDWRTLFQYAIDNNNNALADTIIKGEQDEIQSQLLSYWNNSQAEKFNINKKHLYLIVNGRKEALIPPTATYGTIICNRVKRLEEVITKLQSVKQRIIDELSLKLDKNKLVGDLTKEYFETELFKGNIDMVVIKLCVLLEAILRCDYHYEGDLSVMIEKHCQEHGWEDDGWGYSVEANHVKYLQKLRMKRNNIVHSEKNNVDLTLEELKYCIDYICKMG